MRIRRCVIGGVGGDHVGVLVESLAAVRRDTGYTGAGLSVIHAIPAANYHLRSKLVSKAEARLNVVPIGHIVSALAGSCKHLAAFQRKVYRITSHRIGIGDASTVQGA